MEKIKEKFQEKFQKWLDNFCLRGNCSSVRAGLKYFTRYHLSILLWIILGRGPHRFHLHHFERLASKKKNNKEKATLRYHLISGFPRVT